ncbi:MAG TPA: hypothetical protein VIL24_03250 [Clostridia bacterium]
MSELYLGKFQSVEELIKAYQNLEAEHTKKCQLISQLKKELQELTQVAQKSPEQTPQASPEPIDNSAEPIQTEPLGVDAESKDNVCKTDLYDLDQEIERFFQAFPQAKDYAALIGQAITVQKPVYADFLAAFVQVLLQKSPQDYLDDSEFLERFVYNNENIRQYFIQSYLDGLLKGGKPISIFERASAISVTPPARAKNLAEARDLAKKILTK